MWGWGRGEGERRQSTQMYRPPRGRGGGAQVCHGSPEVGRRGECPVSWGSSSPSTQTPAQVVSSVMTSEKQDMYTYTSTAYNAQISIGESRVESPMINLISVGQCTCPCPKNCLYVHTEHGYIHVHIAHVQMARFEACSEVLQPMHSHKTSLHNS